MSENTLAYKHFEKTAIEKEDNYSLKDSYVNSIDFIRYLISKWIYIIALLILLVACGIFLYYRQKPKFEAVSTFILEEKQSGLGGLSSIASQIGLDIAGAGGGSLFAGDNILEILKSRKIIQNVLLTPIDSNSNKKLADLFIENNGWKNKWVKSERLNGINFNDVIPSYKLTLPQDSVLNLAHTQLIKNDLKVERLVKKGSMLKVSVKSSNEVFAKLFVERLIDNAKRMYVQVKTGNASINVGRMEKKADSLLRLLNSKSYQTAGSFVIDANPGLKSIAVPLELNQRDKLVLQTLYGEVVKNLEISRISLMQQTPVIEVLDSPSFPLIDKRKSLAFFILISALVSLTLSTAFFLFKYTIR
jgi:uncharacterized membrane protein (UPF0136 family)